MGKEGKTTQVEFHSKATEIFFAFFRSFEREVSTIDRNKQEYDFQKLKKKYVTSLEQELQSTAKTILIRHKNKMQPAEVDPLLRQFITEYLHRFVQKISEL